MPLFVRWPEGKLRHGEKITELATVQDILPTLIDFCGLEKKDVDYGGVSLAGPLRNAKVSIPTRTVVSQSVLSWRDCSGKQWDTTCVMRGPWRMLSPETLYNIHDDPGQTKNVISQHPEIARLMVSEYESWYKVAKPLHDQVKWLIVGEEKQGVSEFTSLEWRGTCTDTVQHLRQGGGGYYNIRAKTPGRYSVSFRRWPKEMSRGVGDKIGQARLTITPTRGRLFDPRNENRPVFAKTVSIGADQNEMTFAIDLPAGDYEFAPDFLDHAGNVVISAMYLSIEKR